MVFNVYTELVEGGRTLEWAGIQRRLHSEFGAPTELWKIHSIWTERRKRIESLGNKI